MVCEWVLKPKKLQRRCFILEDTLHSLMTCNSFTENKNCWYHGLCCWDETILVWWNLFSKSDGDGFVKIWDLNTRRQISQLTHSNENAIGGIISAQNIEEYLFTQSRGGSCKIWNLDSSFSTTKEIRSIPIDSINFCKFVSMYHENSNENIFERKLKMFSYFFLISPTEIFLGFSKDSNKSIEIWNTQEAAPIFQLKPYSNQEEMQKLGTASIKLWPMI